MRISDIIQEAQWEAPGGYSSGRYKQHGKVNPTDKGLPVRNPQGRTPIEDPESDYGDDNDTIGQTFGSDDVDTDRAIFSQEVYNWLQNNKKLFSRDGWEVLMMRFWDNRTLEEVAKLKRLSMERIRQIEAKAIRILRTNSEFAANFKPQSESIVDEEPASRALCTSGKSDSALGASQLSSCKSQGYRTRDGGKSHKVGHERIKVRGKKIKGKKYGGPLPDWS